MRDIHGKNIKLFWEEKETNDWRRYKKKKSQKKVRKKRHELLRQAEIYYQSINQEVDDQVRGETE